LCYLPAGFTGVSQMESRPQAALQYEAPLSLALLGLHLLRQKKSQANRGACACTRGSIADRTGRTWTWRPPAAAARTASGGACTGRQWRPPSTSSPFSINDGLLFSEAITPSCITRMHTAVYMFRVKNQIKQN
jgi:hypothetical protein